ncbi:hypothetical protein LRY58_02010 [Candidatus Woesebacteria bacterium]|nr:hypothetical protein [Candidatus Woesebacteria bacterium]MCD8546709.1 hypothetical protein [Candidatus Woesebacteria bacterium]
MRKVLRESLSLLLAGQISSILREDAPQHQMQLSYEDFSQLQPDVADSSWRGAMLKAKRRRWVMSRQEGEFTRFQLTKYGREQLAADFAAFQRVREYSTTWTLLILQPLEGKRQQYAALKRELDQRGAALVVSSVYAWPSEVYNQDLVRRLEELGFIPCFLPIDPRKSRPTQLEAFWRSGRALQRKIRVLEKTSKDCASLLTKLHADKKIASPAKK